MQAGHIATRFLHFILVRNDDGRPFAEDWGAQTARTVFRSSQTDTLDSEALISRAAVGGKTVVNGPWAEDAYYCKHSYDELTQAFAPLRGDAAAADSDAEDSAFQAGSSDSSESESDSNSSAASDDDESDDGRVDTESVEERAQPRKQAAKRAGGLGKGRGRRTQGGDIWAKRHDALELGVGAPSHQAALDVAADSPVAAAQKLLTLSARPDTLPCRDAEKQARTLC